MEPNANGGFSLGKAILWLVVLVLIVGSFVLYGSSGSAKKDAIKIGVLLPLTGDAASFGEPARKMIELAVEEINKTGGVGGQPLELVVEDSKCNGSDAATSTSKLINEDKVQVIIGGFCNSETLAAVPLVTEKKVTLLSPASGSAQLTGASAFFFRIYPSDAVQGEVLATISSTDKKWKKVGILQEQTDYARDIYDGFSKTFTALDGTVVKEEFASNATDFKSVVTKMKSAKLDALFIDAQTSATAALVLKQIEEQKWKPVILLSSAVSGDPKTILENKTMLEGALAAEFGVTLNGAQFAAALTAYQTKYGNESPYQSYAQTEYDAVYMVRDALVAVGNDGTKIAEWFRMVKDFDGASGKITIQADGDRDGGYVAKTVKDGKVELYQK